MTLEVVTFLFGAILFGAALLGGGLKVGGGVEIPPITSGARLVAGISGVFFLIFAFWWSGRGAAQEASLPDASAMTQTTVLAGAPAATETPQPDTPLPATATPTETAAATETAPPETPTAEATEPFEIHTATPSPTATPPLFAGPFSGALAHDPDNEWPETYHFKVDIGQFDVEGIVFNPYASQVQPWAFGMIFRRNSKNNSYYHLSVRSDGVWDYGYFNEEGNWFPVGNGVTDRLNLTVNGSNQIKIVAFEADGCFYLNGDQVAGLDLSHLSGAGNMSLTVGYWTGDEKAGAVTSFQDFVVRRATSLDCG